MEYLNEQSKLGLLQVLEQPLTNSKGKINSDLNNYLNFKNNLKQNNDALGYFKHLLKAININDVVEGTSELGTKQKELQKRISSPKMLYPTLTSKELSIVRNLKLYSIINDLESIIYQEPDKAKQLNISNNIINKIKISLGGLFQALNKFADGLIDKENLLSYIEESLTTLESIDDLGFKSIDNDISALKLLKSKILNDNDFKIDREKILGRDDFYKFIRSNKSGRLNLASILKGYFIDNYQIDQDGNIIRRNKQISEENSVPTQDTEIKNNKQTSEETPRIVGDEEVEHPDEIWENEISKEESANDSTADNSEKEEPKSINGVPLIIYASNDLPSLEYINTAMSEYVREPISAVITDNLKNNEPVKQIKDTIFKGEDVPLYWNVDGVDSTTWVKRSFKYAKERDGVLLCIDYNKRGSPYAELIRYAESQGLKNIRLEIKTSKDKSKTYERTYLDGELVDDNFPTAKTVANDPKMLKLNKPNTTTITSKDAANDPTVVQDAANDSNIAEPNPEDKDYNSFLNQTGSQTAPSRSTTSSNTRGSTSASNQTRQAPTVISDQQLHHISGDVENDYIKNELKNTLVELSKYTQEQDDISPQELQDFIYNNLNKYFKHIQDGTPVWNNKKALQRYCQMALKDPNLSKNTKKMFKDVFQNYSLTPNGSLIPDKMFLSDSGLGSGKYSALYMKPLTYKSTWQKSMKKKGNPLAKAANKLLGWTNTRFAESIEH